MKSLVLFCCCLLALTVAGQGVLPAHQQALYLAQLRHTSVARTYENSPSGQGPAAAYLQALRAWYRSDLRPEAQVAAAEDFFTAHEAILRHRATLRQRPLPALALHYDSSAAHLQQLVHLSRTARRLPVAAQMNLVRRVGARERALWRAVQAHR